MDPISECTFNRTGANFMLQQYATCYDCFDIKRDEGACLACINKCHAGHRISEIKCGEFYCDCGAKGCAKPSKKHRCATSQICEKDPEEILPSKNSFFEVSNNLGSKLYKHADDGAVYSPVSITTALSLLHFGAGNRTEKQITDLLGAKLSKTEISAVTYLFNNNIVKMANALIVNPRHQINAEYLKKIRDLAMVSIEDFSQSVMIANKVNAHIKERTNGLITNIITPADINSDTMMIILNTLYFEAAWKNPFDQSRTMKNLFNGTIPCDMMNQTSRMYYYTDNRVQMLRMMYTDEDYCMEFYLAKDPAKPIYPFDIDEINIRYRRVNAYIPKFTHRKKINMIPLLKKMGVSDMFDQVSADFFNICDKGSFVSNIIHEAVVIVDEKTTKAAAITHISSSFFITSMPETPVLFNADRTFTYRIVHLPTKTDLFVGCYTGK